MSVTIDTKGDMYRLLYTGRFGNYPLAWKSLADLLASDYRGLVSVRSLQTANPVRLYGVPRNELQGRIADLTSAERSGGLVFSEFMPHGSHGTIQGEWDGFNLTYTFAKAPMRQAFDLQQLFAEGPRARLILQGSLDASDYEWLEELLADFPGHVVEFSGYKIRVGTLRRRMIVWEVRRY